MCDCVEHVVIAKAAPSIVALNRKTEARAKPLASSLEEWLQRYARAELRDVNRKLKSGGYAALTRSVKKRLTRSEIDRLDEQLRALLMRYGLAQAEESGKATARGLRQRWSIQPSLLEDIARDKENHVKLVLSDTVELIRESIKAQVSMAMAESPRPSVTELGRRIREVWTGDKGLFSPIRAKTIARNEVAQSRALGQATAFTDIGIEVVGWLPFPNDGKSGKRRHWKMKGELITVKAMNGLDPSKWFELPSGERCPYPKWMGLAAGETVNCRCNLVAKG